MNFAVAAAVFPVIFLGELPDKTMFASLLLAARGRPLAVWLGAAGAFLVHVTIAVALGGALSLAPHRVVDAVAAALFLAGSVWAYRETEEEQAEEGVEAVERLGNGRSAATAFGVIFLAEWGDLTQILTANLAAKYHDPFSVGVGATLALWAVAGIAVVGSRYLLRLPMSVVRKITAAILLALAIFSLVQAIR